MCHLTVCGLVFYYIVTFNNLIMEFRNFVITLQHAKIRIRTSKMKFIIEKNLKMY